VGVPEGLVAGVGQLYKLQTNACSAARPEKDKVLGFILLADIVVASATQAWYHEHVTCNRDTTVAGC
jgi:hypothetical protein